MQKLLQRVLSDKNKAKQNDDDNRVSKGSGNPEPVLLQGTDGWSRAAFQLSAGTCAPACATVHAAPHCLAPP